MSKNYSSILSYKIEFKYDESIYTLKRPLPQEIKFYISGTGWQILKKKTSFFSSPALQYPLDRVLAQRQPFLYTNSLKSYIQGVLSDVKITEIVADTLILEVQKKVTRTFQIKVDTNRIYIARGYKRTTNVQAIPDKIQITGDEKMLDKIPNPLIINIKERNIAQDFSKSVNITLPSNAKQVKLPTPKVWIQFGVEKLYTNSFKVFIKPFNIKDKLTLKEDKLTLTYAYTTQDYGKIQVADFEVGADFSTFNPKDSTVKAVLLRKPEILDREDIKITDKIKVIPEKPEAKPPL